jgi:DNA replication protein DnaD
MKRVDNPTTPQKNGDRKWGTKEVDGVVVGRDKTVVPPEEVEQFAQIGLKDKEIADWFGINDNTLRFNFSVELLKGREKLKMSLRQAMIKNATQHMNAALQIFMAKNLLGMSDSPFNTDNTEPLPWVEADEATVNIEEYVEEQDENLED